jgi:hypothetical protein
MTPKQKAKELVDKYNKDIILYWDLSYNQAKKCALIAVDEIINASPIEPMIFLNGMRSTIPYWQEVKKEIEAL